MTLIEAAKTIFGAQNDERLWDGWRTYGDAWARRYLRDAVRHGADRAGAQDQIDAADAVLEA